MTRAAAAPRPRLRETEVVAATARYLEGLGYRVYPNLDAKDYFDLVARKGREVGLVEAKVSGSRAVLVQALRRRVWGDWVAVVLPSERSAERLAARTAGTRARPVGVWATVGDTVRVVRAAAAWFGPGDEDPYADLRERFRLVLDRLDSGEIPADVPWDGVVGAVRRASGGRGFKEWRLDEPLDRGP